MHKYTAELTWKNILLDMITQTLRYSILEAFNTVIGIFKFCPKHSKSKGKTRRKHFSTECLILEVAFITGERPVVSKSVSLLSI